MIGLIAKRLLALVAILLVVTFATFALSNVMPGDPAQMMSGPRATQRQVDAMRIHLGLDRPLLIRYGGYLRRLVHGDLGSSIETGRSVAQDLAVRAPATLELMSLAVLLSVASGVSLGVLAARARDSVADHAIRTWTVLGISTPTFWLGLVLFLVFYLRLGWLPPGGRLDPGAAPPAAATGFYLVDFALQGDWQGWLGAARHLILPVLTLSVASTGLYARMVRASMLNVLDEDYIRTARANGLRAISVFLRHALRNALLPFLTLLGVELGHLLFGSVIVETIFAWPGLGSLALNAIQALDFPVIMGFTVLTSITYVLANLAVDLAYAWADPRLRGP